MQTKEEGEKGKKAASTKANEKDKRMQCVNLGGKPPRPPKKFQKILDLYHILWYNKRKKRGEAPERRKKMEIRAIEKIKRMAEIEASVNNNETKKRAYNDIVKICKIARNVAKIAEKEEKRKLKEYEELIILSDWIIYFIKTIQDEIDGRVMNEEEIKWYKEIKHTYYKVAKKVKKMEAEALETEIEKAEPNK